MTPTDQPTVEKDLGHSDAIEKSASEPSLEKSDNAAQDASYIPEKDEEYQVTFKTWIVVLVR